MELVNTHCHTGYCGHAEGSVDEYVAAAREAGLSLLAFTDHYPVSSAYDWDNFISVPREKLDEYVADIHRVRMENPDMEIICGCEMDWLGDYEDREFSEEDFKPFELMLGSVHFVDAWGLDDPAKKERWDEPGMPDKTWERYFHVWCEAATTKDFPFQIMSHPDLVKKFGYYPTFNPSELYDMAVDAIRTSGRMIELNTSGRYYACQEMFPTPELLKRFCRAGVPCSIGTDAHTPANVARSLDEGLQLLYDAGYRQITVPTATGDRRTITIE